LLWAGEEKHWIYSVIESLQDSLIGTCGGRPHIIRKLEAFREKNGGDLNDTEKSFLMQLDTSLLSLGVILDSPTDSSAEQSSSSSQPSTDEYDAGDEQSNVESCGIGQLGMTLTTTLL
jgi:hypothetical protein